MEPIVAPATPMIPSERGVLRLSGDGVFSLVLARFRPEGAPLPAAFRRWSGRGWFRCSKLQALVPGSLWLFRGPNSPTGEDGAELHLPGIPHLLELMLGDLVAAQARLAAPGEFTRRAVRHGRMDLGQAEAVLALVRATDEREQAQAVASLTSGLSRRVGELRARIQAWLIPLELQFDFSDQGLELPEDRGASAVRRTILADLSALVATCSESVHRAPVARVVLVGAPNAGKSSLFNALIGEAKAIESPVAGTTRDWLSGFWRCGSEWIELIDTAGESGASDRWECALAPARNAQAQGADLRLRVFDQRVEVPPIRPGELLVGTHSDLVSPPWGSVSEWASVSSRTGAGLAELADMVLERLSSGARAVDASILVSARQARALSEAHGAPPRAVLAAEQGLEPELVASDLHQCLSALAQVTGENARDDVLDRVFREFCIGK